MSVRFQTGFRHLSDLPCVVLHHQNAQAVVSLYGGQVLSYQPTPTTERLWFSPLAQWQNQQAIRGGIPICWPWFGALDPRFARVINATTHDNVEQCNAATVDTRALPNHGLVRTAMWQYQDMGTSQTDNSKLETAATVTLSCTVTPPWRHAPVTIYLEICLSHQLSIRLYTKDTLLQQAALHSYFSLQHLAKQRETAPHRLLAQSHQAAPVELHTNHHADAQPLDDCMVFPLAEPYLDKTQPSAQLIQNTSDALSFVGEIDRIYLNTAPTLWISGKDAATHGATRIQQYGHDSSVLWNPNASKGAQLRDVTEAYWREFVCVETAWLQLAAVDRPAATVFGSARVFEPASLKPCQLDLRQVISAD
jgi:glucose-6-phosphate 1-epimerase